MLIFLVTLIAAVLNTAIGVEHQFLSVNLARSKRGIVEAGNNAPQDYKFRQSRYHDPNVQNTRADNARSPTFQKGSKDSPQESSLNGQKYGGSPTYEDLFKQSPPYANLQQYGSQSNEQSSPHFDKLFTMTASYKVASSKVKPSKQVAGHSRNQNSGIEGTYGAFPSLNGQLPLYKSNYPLPKSAELQTFAPVFQNNAYSDTSNEKKASLPILQLQNTQDLSTYLSNFQSQPFLLNPTDYRFSFVGKIPKVNNVQSSSPFLSPASSFQSQVVPISTALNSPQFPRYKGASIEVYPSVAGFSTTAYQPLQTQPQLHFEHDTVQHLHPVGSVPQSTPAQEIRADVEIIDKVPTTPPPKKHDDDDEDDGGYIPTEKEYRPNSEDDEEYEDKSERHFKAPRTEGNFKPSTTFPFKQYDEKFGKFSNQKQNEEADDDDSEKILSSKYQSKDTSSKPYYSRQEEEEEGDDDDRRSYEKQKTEESSEDTYRPKYFNENFDEEFEASYRKELPQQRYVHAKESLRRDESEDPSSQENRMSFKYYKPPQGFQDNEAHGSDNLEIIISKAIHEGAFGYRIPKQRKKF